MQSQHIFAFFKNSNHDVIGPAFSDLAFFYPGNLVPHFPVVSVVRSLIYLVPYWSIIFRSWIFSRPVLPTAEDSIAHVAELLQSRRFLTAISRLIEE